MYQYPVHATLAAVCERLLSAVCCCHHQSPQQPTGKQNTAPSSLPLRLPEINSPRKQIPSPALRPRGGGLCHGAQVDKVARHSSHVKSASIFNPPPLSTRTHKQLHSLPVSVADSSRSLLLMFYLISRNVAAEHMYHRVQFVLYISNTTLHGRLHYFCSILPPLKVACAASTTNIGASLCNYRI